MWVVDESFEDLLQANRRFADTFALSGFDGLAHAGVAMVTCMDSRIEPLGMIGLKVGDAKIMRTPGGRVTEDALVGCILGVHLLKVERILIVPHTRCAMAAGTDAEIAEAVRNATGAEIGDLRLGASPDQDTNLLADVSLLRNHPLIGDRATVGGFKYDVDTGLLTRLI
ncbi:carbonic anhydrase [Microlunatus panaciterrae]